MQENRYYNTLQLHFIQAGYASCQLISANVKNTNITIAVYVLFLVYSLLLGGFIIPQDSYQMHFNGLYILIVFYGFAALLINEFEDKSYGTSVFSGCNRKYTQEFYFHSKNFRMCFHKWFLNKEKP